MPLRELFNRPTHWYKIGTAVNNSGPKRKRGKCVFLFLSFHIRFMQYHIAMWTDRQADFRLYVKSSNTIICIQFPQALLFAIFPGYPIQLIRRCNSGRCNSKGRNFYQRLMCKVSIECQ